MATIGGGGTSDDAKWRPWLYGAFALLGVAVIMLTVATTLALTGSDPVTKAETKGTEPATEDDGSDTGSGSTSGSPTSGSEGTTSPTASTSETPTPDGTSEATGTPTEEGGGGFDDDSTLVPCTIDAPLSQTTRVAEDCVIGPLVSVEGYSLNEGAAAAYEEMKAAAAADGIDIFIISAYRDYQTQVQLYLQEVAISGPDQNTSAKPGHSEHQLGTTVDLNELSESFGESPAGLWLQANAGSYGFQMSYPAGAEGITGYAYEPWHWRWWG